MKTAGQSSQADGSSILGGAASLSNLRARGPRWPKYWICGMTSFTVGSAQVAFLFAVLGRSPDWMLVVQGRAVSRRKCADRWRYCPCQHHTRSGPKDEAHAAERHSKKGVPTPKRPPVPTLAQLYSKLHVHLNILRLMIKSCVQSTNPFARLLSVSVQHTAHSFLGLIKFAESF